MNDGTPNPYDQVRYAGYPYAQTHPDRLAAMATLFGMNPAPVANCRTLELGCGEGANLIPMAFGLPESRFVGVDLAASPVATGNSAVAELGLKNIALHCVDLRAVGRDFGEFDYIIAHGVYSWVPAEVRDRLLAVCGELLAPQGVVYVSYNVYPGYYLRQMAREMMLFHVRAVGDPSARIEEGMTLLQLILGKFPDPALAKADLYSNVIAEQVERMSEYRHREQIFHDELAPVNAPVYFYQFARQAWQHGLQYLAEANFFEMQDHLYPQPLRDLLGQFGPDEVIVKEQYLDFLKGRGFRQTLLCRQGASVNRDLHPSQLEGFYLESPARSVSASPDLRAGVTEEFCGSLGSRLQTDCPLAKAALIGLGEVAPRALRWGELVPTARARLDAAGVDAAVEDGQEQELAQVMFAAVETGLARLHIHQPQLTLELSERPAASRLARWQAAHGGMVTNLLHQNVELDDVLSRQLLRLLDGTRDRAALLDELVGLAAQSGLLKTPDGATLDDPAALRQVMTGALEQNLQRCARMALLTG
jgi:methyltransferase-like protein